MFKHYYTSCVLFSDERLPAHHGASIGDISSQGVYCDSDDDSLVHLHGVLPPRSLPESTWYPPTRPKAGIP